MTPSLNVNVFTAPEKTYVGERSRPFGPPLAWDAMTELYPDWASPQAWLMFGFR
jgi:hypothetical protein